MTEHDVSHRSLPHQPLEESPRPSVSHTNGVNGGANSLTSLCGCCLLRSNRDRALKEKELEGDVTGGPLERSPRGTQISQQSNPNTMNNNNNTNSSKSIPYPVENKVLSVPDLPPGWIMVQSRSRPDRTAFQNEFTGERISWVPTEPASQVRGEIRKSRKAIKRVGSQNSDKSVESSETLTRLSARLSKEINKDLQQIPGTATTTMAGNNSTTTTTTNNSAGILSKDV
jgi:hypothetical protein